MVSDPSLADDLAQETFLSALKAKELPEAGNTRGWLATIMRRKLSGTKRTEARRPYVNPLYARPARPQRRRGSVCGVL